MRDLNELKPLESFRLSEQLRPLRLLPIGNEALWTKADAGFLNHAREEICRSVKYKTPSRSESLELGATFEYITHDYRRGFINFRPMSLIDLVKFTAQSGLLPAMAYITFPTALVGW